MDTCMFRAISKGECCKRAAAVTFQLLHAEKLWRKKNKTLQLFTLDEAVLNLEQFCYLCIVPGLFTCNNYSITAAAFFEMFPFCNGSKCL